MLPTQTISGRSLFAHVRDQLPFDDPARALFPTDEELLFLNNAVAPPFSAAAPRVPPVVEQDDHELRVLGGPTDVAARPRADLRAAAAPTPAEACSCWGGSLWDLWYQLTGGHTSPRPDHDEDISMGTSSCGIRPCAELEGPAPNGGGMSQNGEMGAVVSHASLTPWTKEKIAPFELLDFRRRMDERRAQKGYTAHLDQSFHEDSGTLCEV